MFFISLVDYEGAALSPDSSFCSYMKVPNACSTCSLQLGMSYILSIPIRIFISLILAAVAFAGNLCGSRIFAVPVGSVRKFFWPHWHKSVVLIPSLFL